MPSPQDRVIEAAVRPFSDNAELKLAAAELLARTSGNLPEETLARWDAVDAKQRGPVRRWLPWGMLAVTSALMWLADAKEMIAYFQWVKWAKDSVSTMPPQAEQRTAAHVDARGKLLVFGDLASKNSVERKERLWQSDPENPAYFAEYAAVFASIHQSLPPDFLPTARRLDPDNAWFTYLAAFVDAWDAVRSADGKPPWKTLGQAQLDRALSLLRGTRTQTKCTRYTTELLRQRLALLPQGNLVERYDSIGSIKKTSDIGFFKFQFYQVSQVLAAGAWGAGERGDVPAFQELVKDGDHFLRGIYQDEVSTLTDEVVRALFVRTLAQTYAESAAKLGLREEADMWKKIGDESAKRQNPSRIWNFTIDGKVVDPMTATGSMLGGSVRNLGKYLETPLPLTDADVKPGRLLDHEILSRFFNYICWLVMALCLGLAAVYRFRVSELSRRLAARMTELLRPADWGWIVGLGILLPFAFVMGINRLTPLGGRAFGMKGPFMLMPACHFLGLVVLWLVVPVQIIRWRLAKRAGGFGFSGHSRIGWVAVACAVAFVPWIGWAAISESFPLWWVLSMNALGIQLDVTGGSPWLFWQALVLLGIPALWLAGVAVRALFCRADRQLHRAAAARVLVVSSAAALAVLCLASQGFKAAEHYWFARDELGRMDPARPGWSVYEYRVAVQLRKEMRDILGYNHH
jgi:hypothetical protein